MQFIQKCNNSKCQYESKNPIKHCVRKKDYAWKPLQVSL